MKILVVAATQQEIEPFSKLNSGVETLISGVGIPSTVYHLTKKLLGERYDLVIQAGIGGSFTKKIKNGEVIAVEKDAFSDIGAEENKEFKTLFQMGFGNENDFPFRNGWLENNSQALEETHLRRMKAITINTIHDRKKQSKMVNKIFKAQVESMEGAAFHFVCLQLNTAFLQLRGISNVVGERDKSKWKIKDAIENLNSELKILIDSLCKPRG